MWSIFGLKIYRIPQHLGVGGEWGGAEESDTVVGPSSENLFTYKKSEDWVEI